MTVVQRSIKTENEQQFKEALNFTSRWGFLSKEIYFKFFCDRNRSKQFRHWQAITKTGYLVKSKVNDNICYLTLKGRRHLNQQSQTSRFHLYIQHDSLVAHFILNLQKQKKIMRYWIESELKSDQIAAYSVLGAERVDRFPDAVIDVIVDGQVQRYALEIERKVKSRFRYNKMVMHYSYYKKLKGVLFGCDRLSTNKAIQRAFFDSHLATTDFKIGTYLCSDFEKDSLNCLVVTQRNTENLEAFLFGKATNELAQNEELKWDCSPTLKVS